MRKKFASSVLAASLAFAAVPAVSPIAATVQAAEAEAGANTDVGRGIENAFNLDVASSMQEDSFKGFMEMVFKPYKLMFSGNAELSSQGFTQVLINWAIITVSVTIIGQAVQMVMSNLPR